MKYSIIILFLFMLSPVYSFIDCQYDDEPYIRNTIDWTCETDLNSRCYGVIYFNNRIISISPEIRDIEQVGRVDYFSDSLGIVNIKFDNRDLFQNVEYNFSVDCVNNNSIEHFSRLVTPQRFGLRSIGYRSVFVKENMSYILALILLIVAGGGIWFLIKTI